MIRKRLQILPQYLAPQHLLTQLAGWLSVRKSLWFKNWQINHLINRYGVDINEAVLTDPADYPTFNSFFTRRLKPELRPIVTENDALASPADGTISQCGHIDNNLLFQAKGFHFTLENLLGGTEAEARPFVNGEFATIYLSPKDYHRVHMPFTGVLRETVFIPGRLFSVNQHTAQNVPNLFARNERLVCLFETEVGSMAVIFVGAMLVGSINTVWGGKIHANQITRQSFPTSSDQAIKIERGAEIGHFEMGSTVILLLPQGAVQWPATLKENSLVKMGQFLGKMKIS
ncbi:MAG: archaetidylserine decarboxylase [Gammaproteobacteria bacterium]|nr:archaetidylserine decarboxylase [Gammaproteobacteria bacterium]